MNTPTHTHKQKIHKYLPDGFKIRNFPIIPDIARTTYKIQGDTSDSIVNTEWVTRDNAGKINKVLNKPTQGYVIISRTTTRRDFLCLQRLLDTDIDFFKPAKHLLEEDNRLLKLHKNTMEEYKNSLQIHNNSY